MSREANGVGESGPFKDVERAVQTAWLAGWLQTHGLPAAALGAGGYSFCLHKRFVQENLSPSIREWIAAYFGRPAPNNITWHRYANHALSSQVCCLNFLTPLADKPLALGKVIGAALGIAPPKMLPILEGVPGGPWYVGFEWVGKGDYLGEGRNGVVSRGANATSADSVVRFEHQGLSHTLLIEWKYTESYGGRIDDWDNPKSVKTRTERYAALAFGVGGVVESGHGLDLHAFAWDPFYQLLRQQLLARQMQKKREDGADRVRVLHISPAGNKALHRVTSRPLRELDLGDDAFQVYRSLLAQPDSFIDVTTERAFGPLLASGDPEIADWAGYIKSRYTFLNAVPRTAVVES